MASGPIFWLERMKTPYLAFHDDDDNAVPWCQGIGFFDRSLLGKPEPEWISKGMPYLERGRRDIDVLFKKPGEKISGAQKR